MIDNKDLINNLISKFGNPLYVFREDDFIDNYKQFVSCMKDAYDKYQLSYSYKTNYAPYICKLVKELGGYAEVVSDMEYSIAKKIGYEDSKIVYNGPVKDELSIKMMLNGGKLNIDNIEELDRILNFQEVKDGKQIEIGLRLNFDIGQNFVSRFGIDADNEEAIKEVLCRISSHRNVTIAGLHCHIGRSRNIESWKNRAIRMTQTISKYFSNCNLKYIDLGSGMFAKMEDSFASQFGNDIPSYFDYAKAIGDVLNDYYKDYSYEDKPILLTEPGTTLINSYIDFVSEVKSIKHIKNKTFIVLNCSKHNLGEVCTLKRLPIRTIANGSAAEHIDAASFVGYTCLEHDVMYNDYSGDLAVGDYIIFGNVGGYSNVSKPPFIAPNCPMVAISKNGISVIKRKETVDDILATYNI